MLAFQKRIVEFLHKPALTNFESMSFKLTLQLWAHHYGKSLILYKHTWTLSCLEYPHIYKYCSFFHLFNGVCYIF